MTKKADELARRLRRGLPASRAPTLLAEVGAERAREGAPLSNPQRFANPTAQRLSNLWFSQQATATVGQKDAVGLAFISSVLEMGDEAAMEFAQGDRTIYEQVGLRQGGVEHYTPNLRVFWARVREIFPGVYGDEDVVFLVDDSCGVQGASHFMWQLEIPLAEESPVLRALSVNAHAYK